MKERSSTSACRSWTSQICAKPMLSVPSPLTKWNGHSSPETSRKSSFPSVASWESVGRCLRCRACYRGGCGASRHCGLQPTRPWIPDRLYQEQRRSSRRRSETKNSALRRIPRRQSETGGGCQGGRRSKRVYARSAGPSLAACSRRRCFPYTWNQKSDKARRKHCSLPREADRRRHGEAE